MGINKLVKFGSHEKERKKGGVLACNAILATSFHNVPVKAVVYLDVWNRVGPGFSILRRTTIHGILQES